jgi:hypothetical protein
MQVSCKSTLTCSPEKISVVIGNGSWAGVSQTAGITGFSRDSRRKVATNLGHPAGTRNRVSDGFRREPYRLDPIVPARQVDVCASHVAEPISNREERYAGLEPAGTALTTQIQAPAIRLPEAKDGSARDQPREKRALILHCGSQRISLGHHKRGTVWVGFQCWHMVR